MDGLEYLTDLWKGEDVFIVGGGPSLKAFDFGRLVGRRVIGCNDAYQLSADVVDVSLFGDMKWFDHHSNLGLLERCKRLVACHPGYQRHPIIFWFKRYKNGLHKDGLGWMRNTGGSAINLALIMGARRIFLLGFDMGRKPKECNWHINPLDNPGMKLYREYCDRIKSSCKNWKETFPACEDIVNLNPDSNLDCFRRSTWEREFMGLDDCPERLKAEVA